MVSGVVFFFRLLWKIFSLFVGRMIVEFVLMIGWLCDGLSIRKFLSDMLVMWVVVFIFIVFLVLMVVKYGWLSIFGRLSWIISIGLLKMFLRVCSLGMYCWVLFGIVRLV